MLTVATAGALSRERPDLHVTAFDPGLMPGTGLAHDYPAGLRLLWHTALKGLRVLPFASSAQRSGAALATLLTADPPPAPTGSYLDVHLRVIAASARARDHGFQDEVLRDSRALVRTP